MLYPAGRFIDTRKCKYVFGLYLDIHCMYSGTSLSGHLSNKVTVIMEPTVISFM